MSSTKSTSSKEKCTAPATGPGSISYALAKAFRVEKTSKLFADWLATEDKATQDLAKKTPESRYTIKQRYATTPMDVTELCKCETREKAEQKVKGYADRISEAEDMEDMEIRMDEDDMGFEVCGDQGVYLMRLWTEKDGDGGEGTEKKKSGG